MGQYYIIVNATRKEYINPSRCSSGIKMAELVQGKLSGILFYLTCDTTEKGGGDIEGDYRGRWKGNRIYVVGDYHKSGMYKAILKGCCKGYKDVSLALCNDYFSAIGLSRIE